jgi:hypothetical protein
LTQLKKELGKDFEQNTKKDLKRYDEIRLDIDSLRKADSDTLTKIDGLDKRYVGFPAVDKINSDIRVKFETLDKKSALFAKNNDIAFEEINNRLKGAEAKYDDVKKSIEGTKVDTKDKLGKLDYKIIDL